MHDSIALGAKTIFDKGVFPCPVMNKNNIDISVNSISYCGPGPFSNNLYLDASIFFQCWQQYIKQPGFLGAGGCRHLDDFFLRASQCCSG